MKARQGVLAVLILAVACGSAAGQASVSVHLTMGNPSGAVAEQKQRDNFLVVHDQFALSWNASRGHPNWVSWRLAGEDIGNADRTGDNFEADPALPKEFPRIVRGLYSTSGFDLGHLCPAHDRSRHAADLRATFVTSNCIPQAPKLNRGIWQQMEAYRRARAADGFELYVIAGPAGTAGRGSRGYETSIGDDSRAVNVPAICWAVWIELHHRTGDDVARIKIDTPAYAVAFRNDEEQPQHWRDRRLTVDELEQLTRFDFFSEVPTKIQRDFEAHVPALYPETPNGETDP